MTLELVPKRDPKKGYMPNERERLLERERYVCVKESGRDWGIIPPFR